MWLVRQKATTLDKRDVCCPVLPNTSVRQVQVEVGLLKSLRPRTVVSPTRASQRLRPVAVSASLAPSHASYCGPEIVWATGRLMSLNRGFGTSCLLHCGRLKYVGLCQFRRQLKTFVCQGLCFGGA